MPRKQESGSASAARTLSQSAEGVAQTQRALTADEQNRRDSQTANARSMTQQGLQMAHGAQEAEKGREFQASENEKQRGFQADQAAQSRQQQGQQFQQQQRLQAADRDLEYDADKGIYRPTAQRQQQAQQKTDLAERGMRVEETKARSSWESALAGRERESRLLQQSRLKSAEDFQKQSAKVEDGYRGRIKDLNARMDRVRLRELDIKNSPWQDFVASKNPQYKAAMERVKSGKGSDDDYGRIMQGLQAERDMEYIGLAADTGKIATHNFDTPTMQRFMVHRAQVKSTLNNVVRAQMKALQAQGGEVPGGMEALFGDTEARELKLNRMAAQMFQDMELLNSERAALDQVFRSNQSNVDTGGAAPAVTGGAAELERRRSAGQPAAGQPAGGQQQLQRIPKPPEWSQRR